MRPVLFEAFGHSVPSYEFFYGLALLVSVLLAWRRSTAIYGVPLRTALSISLWAASSAVLTVVVSDAILSGSGSASSLIAIAGGGLGATLACERSGIAVWKMAEAGSIPVCVLVAVGRVGCFLHGCCSGIATDMPMGVRFPFDGGDIARHPTQIYYIAAALLIAAALKAVEPRVLSDRVRKRFGAVLWPLFMILYGISYTIIGFFRADSENLWWLPAAVFVASGVVWLVFSTGRSCEVREIIENIEELEEMQRGGL